MEPCHGVATCSGRELFCSVFQSTFWAFLCISQAALGRSLWSGCYWKERPSFVTAGKKWSSGTGSESSVMSSSYARPFRERNHLWVGLLGFKFINIDREQFCKTFADIMEQSNRDTLRKNRQGLLKDMEAKRVASRLYSREIFNEEDKDEVNSKSTALEQGECLLDILPKRGPKAFRVFCDVLHELSPHLESLLRPVQEAGKMHVINCQLNTASHICSELDRTRARMCSFECCIVSVRNPR